MYIFSKQEINNTYNIRKYFSKRGTIFSQIEAWAFIFFRALSTQPLNEAHLCIEPVSINTHSSCSSFFELFSVQFTAQSLKPTSYHFHLDIMEATTRPGLELNFLVVCSYMWLEIIEMAGPSLNLRHNLYLLQDTINSRPLIGTGFYLEDASIQRNMVYKSSRPF